MFFSSAQQRPRGTEYDLLIAAAKFADAHDFCCVWTPERHFHDFGGLFPNPSLTSAALAMITEKIQLRAGSLISPLHDEIRMTEEWSFVDNLSHGRVAISFGSGWNATDFIFYPERYQSRQAVMYSQIETMKKLWRGEALVRQNSFGKDVSVTIHPRPVQSEPPIWITSSGNPETFITAGRIGANVLTHLIGQNIESLGGKIRKYREAREQHGFDPSQGKVSLMLHTFLGADDEAVRAKVRTPFREYLRSAISLEEKAAISGGVISGGHKINPDEVPADVKEELLDITFERYRRSGALMGTPASCRPLVWQLKEIGVDEIACLIDFVDDDAAVMDSLGYLSELRASFSNDVLSLATSQAVNAFVENLEF
jgi:natural product biosynthesis luciferase-like monooxygenase protein